MFDKLKQIQKLKELQSILEKEKIEVEKEGIKVILNGKMEVEEIKLNSELELSQQENLLKDCINDAVSRIQTIAAQKMMQLQ